MGIWVGVGGGEWVGTMGCSGAEQEIEFGEILWCGVVWLVRKRGWGPCGLGKDVIKKIDFWMRLFHFGFTNQEK